MDKEEAKAVLAQELIKLKTLPYSDFSSWVRKKHIEVVVAEGKSGHHYQIELEASWDTKPEGDIHVFAAIDDGGKSSLVPISQDFVISPNGAIID